MKATFGEHDGLCIISDRHESIENATKIVYLNATHGIYMFHFLKNWKNSYKKNTSKIKQSFLDATRAYIIEDFKYQMEQIDKVDTPLRTLSTKWSNLTRLILGVVHI